MQELIEKIMATVEKKKVQSACRKILKKCSFKSSRDLVNITDLATWLYIYEYYDEAIAVCDLLKEFEFTGNYTLWDNADNALCLKARILREQGIAEGREDILEKVNEHRHPELYGNSVDWYRETLNINIKSEDNLNPKRIYDGWRLVKLKFAIRYREAGGHPISDEEFEADIQELVGVLKQMQ